MKGAFTVRAPGRVNLIGDHTDYTGGLVLPMAIDRWTTIRGVPHSSSIELASADEHDRVSLTPPVTDPAIVEPPWGRYVAGVAAELGADVQPFVGRVTTDIPIGAGLSSSAALEVAVALSLGFEGSALDIAQLTRRAEHRSSGVPVGIMDQLCVAAGVENHALLIDCHALTVDPVSLPPEAVVIVRFVMHRTLIGSEYADRVAECAAAEELVGPLRSATLTEVEAIGDPLLRRRARHLVTENERVRRFAAALGSADLREAGRLMVGSHDSLRDDFETSNAEMDRAVDEALATPGVFGARMTGGGFGGCIVALADPATTLAGWRVQAVEGATRVDATVVLHLMPERTWTALAHGEFVSNPSLQQDGFIHCTDEPEVMLAVANAFYVREPGEFVVLYIAVDELTSRCVWESPAHPGDTDQPLAKTFPHIYGPIDRAAVIAVQRVERDSDGRFIRYGRLAPSA